MFFDIGLHFFVRPAQFIIDDHGLRPVVNQDELAGVGPIYLDHHLPAPEQAPKDRPRIPTLMRTI